MPKVFPSKIDRWLSGVMVGAAVFSVLVSLPVLAVPDPRAWLLVLVILLPIVVLPWWLFRSTKYTVGAEELLIRSGPFRWRVPIAKIESITPTNNPLSSPALSLDRLEIKYGPRKSIMVSPLDKVGFVEALRAAGAKV